MFFNLVVLGFVVIQSCASPVSPDKEALVRKLAYDYFFSHFNLCLEFSSEFRLPRTEIKEFIHCVRFCWYCAKCHKRFSILCRLGSNRLDQFTYQTPFNATYVSLSKLFLKNIFRYCERRNIDMDEETSLRTSGSYYTGRFFHSPEAQHWH